MSGTSADGIDVALVQITGRGLDMTAKLLHHHQRPYDRALKSLIFRVRESGQVELSDLARLGREISLCYAAAVNEALLGANLSASHIAAVAAHGQTLYHAPPDTIQWLDPALITAETGCAVVSDFRRADCAAGGQGAPLVPFADYILFRHPTKNRVLLNIGGIANITYLKAGGTLEDVIAFDTGPGNCISDLISRRIDADGPGYDRDGALAAQGSVNKQLIEKLLAHEYFHRPPPKSTDAPAMIRLFNQAVEEFDTHPSNLELLATSTALTYFSIGQQLPKDAQIIVSGGGAKNQLLMRSLKDVKDQPVSDSEAHGMIVEAKEAIAFAILAAATLDAVPSNVPSATGAKRAVVLGSVTPRP